MPVYSSPLLNLLQSSHQTLAPLLLNATIYADSQQIQLLPWTREACELYSGHCINTIKSLYDDDSSCGGTGDPQQQQYSG